MNKPRLHSAKPRILDYFNNFSNHVLRRSDLSKILDRNRLEWNLGSNVGTEKFTKFLLESGRLRKIEFPFPKPYKRETLYLWGDVSLHEACLSLKPNAYFSHYTAVRLHGLTEQLPKTLYLNVEQKNPSVSSGTLTQASIDSAMRRAPRSTKQIATIGDYRVAILQGKNTRNLAVVEQKVSIDARHRDVQLRFTNLERTLIDITVRPNYSGGVAEVLKAFEVAKPRVSVPRLVELLKSLDYIYPYHQAIGFYLTRAGYPKADLAKIHHIPILFDFQLAHGLKKTTHIPEWKLRVPEGF